MPDTETTDAVQEFSGEERTQLRAGAIPVDAYGLELPVREALNELSYSQSIAVLLMTQTQRRAAICRVLELDTLEEDTEFKLPADLRQQAEHWLRVTAQR